MNCSSPNEFIEQLFAPLVKWLSAILFWDPVQAVGFDVNVRIPLVVLWLATAAIFLTIYFRFPGIRFFKIALNILKGKYKEKNPIGQTTHFQALSTALSATVGLGNISGVAIAISVGGPGACLWIFLGGFLGMASKFAECTLGVKYRKLSANGNIEGGPMYYLLEGFKKKNLPTLGRILASLFAVLCVGGAIGGGNMLQSNQTFSLFAHQFSLSSDKGFYFGLLMAILTATVIVGGIRSIANVTSRLVPIMGVLYLLSGITILLLNLNHLGSDLLLIAKSAFHTEAVKGGALGVLIIGLQRACFSNEAGIGSASIAHSTAKTNYPASEGIVALFEPMVDSMIVCTITALVIVSSGVYTYSESNGALLTAQAFENSIAWFPILLTIAVFLFAFSTLISWSYYGQKAWIYLFGNKKISVGVYKLIFLSAIVVGSSSQLNTVIEFSDMMILAMAFPNLIGVFMLLPEIKLELNLYLNYISQKNSNDT